MIQHLDPADLAQRLHGPQPPRLLDIRQPEEHALAKLPGSRLIPLGDLAERLNELDDWRDAEIIVYCHHGVRSLQGTSLLQRAGFERVLNLRGGIDRWSLDIDPTVPRY
jgi:rhodanese-related sulfurtransferase